ncbi:MAG: NADH-quinone oxidoreductase, subunit G, partial [Nitrospinae bacterium RIFCSPLOWO2_12_FULL_47_7]
MEKEQVTLTIDNKTVTVPKGTTVVDAARKVDIEIPVFCYHEKLGPFGCCRMCLIEVEKMPRLTTGCTLTVAQDMVVKTNTPKVIKGRQGVLEFTLLNHPLDCPVCDKGGECPLQNNTFKYGLDITRTQFDRAHNDKAVPLSPVITIDRERCIACQRCTRYSDIIEQESALVMLNRGFHNAVGTFNEQPYVTKFSGNVIDLCPVGALTNTQFRFKSRPWNLKNEDTLCAHCGCNCNVAIGSRLNKFMRVQSRPNDSVDDGWICDKGRFGYGFIESPNRILEARRNGRDAKSLSIGDACTQVAEALRKIVEQYGPNSVGFIGSPYGSNEDLYLYQKLFRLGLGTNNIDHKTYKDTPGLPIPHYDFENIETSKLILLIASDPSEELPILELRIKKALRQGAKLVVLNDRQIALDKHASKSIRYNIGSSQAALASLANVLAKDLGLGTESDNFEKETGIKPDEFERLSELVRGGKVCVIYNPAELAGNSIDALKQLLSVIQKIPDCGAIPAAPATNAMGAMDMGVLPDFYPDGISLAEVEKIRELWGEKAPVERGLSSLEMIKKAGKGELKALWVYRSNPVIDFPGGKAVEEALKKLDLLVVHDMLETET